jgi:hypothetical protein
VLLPATRVYTVSDTLPSLRLISSTRTSSASPRR